MNYFINNDTKAAAHELNKEQFSQHCCETSKAQVINTPLSLKTPNGDKASAVPLNFYFELLNLAEISAHPKKPQLPPTANMDSVEIQGKKRKRKHGSSKSAAEDDGVPTNGAVETEVKSKRSKDRSEKAHKKAKRVEESDGDVEEAVEDIDEPIVGDAEEQVDETMEGEVEDKEASAGEEHDELEAAETVPGVGTLSLPSTGSEAQKFSELNLSEKTMKAIENMKFETVGTIHCRRVSVLT